MVIDLCDSDQEVLVISDDDDAAHGPAPAPPPTCSPDGAGPSACPGCDVCAPGAPAGGALDEADMDESDDSDEDGADDADDAAAAKRVVSPRDNTFNKFLDGLAQIPPPRDEPDLVALQTAREEHVRHTKRLLPTPDEYLRAQRARRAAEAAEKRRAEPALTGDPVRDMVARAFRRVLAADAKRERRQQQRADQMEFDRDDDVCVVCGIDDEHNATPTVACPGCDSVYHVTCLDPPLTAVPKDGWVCPDCVPNLIR